ncbi:UNVERIFIED_ORG: hypothetical protein ABIB52_004222 [Arthrobacter sp. UYCu721]
MRASLPLPAVVGVPQSGLFPLRPCSLGHVHCGTGAPDPATPPVTPIPTRRKINSQWPDSPSADSLTLLGSFGAGVLATAETPRAIEDTEASGAAKVP